jgi:hypothetical protein
MACSAAEFLAFVIGVIVAGIDCETPQLRRRGRSRRHRARDFRNFTVPNMLAGGLVPFLAGLLGGWLGERRPAT